MLKILTSEQQRAADKATIKNEPVSSLNLMERAAERCFEWLIEQFEDKNTTFYFFCGQGNNGGDGLAIARKLWQKGYKNTKIFILAAKKKGSADFEQNLELACKSKIPIKKISSSNDIPKITSSKKIIFIDAIFGSGLSRKAEGIYADTIEFLNNQNGIRISIDIPSGLYSESNEDNNGEIFQAQHTLTFQSPKLAFMFAENERYVGNFSILPIGLDEKYIEKVESNFYFLEKADFYKKLKKRKKFSHKGDNGRALIYAGSYGMAGAAVFTTKAAIKSGAGLTTIAATDKINTVLQATVPEAMFKSAGKADFIEDYIKPKDFNAVAFGPGVGTAPETANLLKLLIQECKSPLVIDADGLNILAANKTWLSFLSPKMILTPHPAEFDRLFGKSENAEQRLKKLIENAQKYNCYIILKGAHTAIAAKNGIVCFNGTGNAGLAKGGSGDTLTGILTGLLAQEYDILIACLLAVYLHGLAADLALKKENISIESMTAADVLENIGRAFKMLS